MERGVRFYQLFISPLLGRSCRYYPSCSTYLLWELQVAPLPEAVGRGLLRILRCNQLFPGGIDYPEVKRIPPPQFWTGDHPPKIEYWLIPDRGKFKIVKAENG